MTYELPFVQEAEPARPAPAAGGIPSLQRRATQTEGQPATFYWALLIGINQYQSPTRDNVGSYQDAVSLRDYLVSLGWRNDHILLIGNLSATRSGILGGLRWLASKTDERSVVVFHYSGHEKPFHTSTDGDTESRDVAIWAADNRYILDGELGSELGRVQAAWMWLNFAVCRAAGFDDTGTQAQHRVVTYSSPETELSYEDPELHHSVFGYFEIVEALQHKKADANGNGVVTVQEAFNYARSRTTNYTGGRQHPAMADQTGGAFVLKPPSGPATPKPSATPAPRCWLLFC